MGKKRGRPPFDPEQLKLLQAALHEELGNVTHAAARMGMTPSAVFHHISKGKITLPEVRSRQRRVTSRRWHEFSDSPPSGQSEDDLDLDVIDRLSGSSGRTIGAAVALLEIRHRLTPSEVRMMIALRSGIAKSALAQHLRITPDLAEQQVQSLCRRLNCQTVEAVPGCIGAAAENVGNVDRLAA